MLDSDLAEIYGYEARTLNRQVKRNISKFLSDFMFELASSEIEMVKSQIVTSRNFYAGQEWGCHKQNGRRDAHYGSFGLFEK